MKVYADNAATTPISDKVLSAMLPYLKENYGNPSALYNIGRNNKAAIEKARAQVAAAIGADSDEIFFTSGGSEADNWAIKGYAAKHSPCRIITSTIEHHAVLNAVERYNHIAIPVDGEGIVDLKALEEALKSNAKPTLVSIMTANNEIGTIQPIAEIANLCHTYNATFHTDAVQAAGHIPINVHELGVDMLSMSAHKFNGCKGIGALYISRNTQIASLIDGGGQERSFRAGTENVAAIVGMGVAIEDAVSKDNGIVAQKRDRILYWLRMIPHSHVNGSMVNRLAGNINISFEGIESESLVLLLDLKSICVSAGSACNSTSIEPSHVLKAIGLSDELARSAIRITIDETITDAQIDYLCECIRSSVATLRRSSPVWQEIVGETNE